MIKSVLIKILASILLSGTIIFFLDKNFHKYETRTTKSNVHASYGHDMDQDGNTDYCSKMNIKSGVYFEFWSKGFLKTIWRDNLTIRGHQEMQYDYDNDGYLEDYFITENDSNTYLNILEFEKLDTSLEVSFRQKHLYKIQDKGISTVKKLINADLNNDGVDELVFIVERGIERRQVIVYDHVKNELKYSKLGFMNFTDIKIHDLDNDGYLDILFSTYATCNLPEDYVDKFADKFNLQQEKVYSDCSAYFGVLDKDLKPKFIKELEGFTNMYRTAIIEEDGISYIVTLESSMLDSSFVPTLTKYDYSGKELLREELPVKVGGKAFEHTTPGLLIDLEVSGKRKFYLQGLCDTIFEMNTDLKVSNYVSNNRINTGSRIKQYDLNDDGQKEILINVDGGYLIYQDGFQDEFFAKTPVSSWDYKIFPILEKGEQTGVYFVAGGESFILYYEGNPNYYWKYALYFGVFFGIYLIMFGLQKFSSYQLEKDNKKLELIVKERTVEVERKNIDLEEKQLLLEVKNNEILDSINYARRIQTAILPSNKILNSHFSDYFVLYKPKDIVAGDFYWCSKLDATKKDDKSLGDLADCVLFGVADCTGHGVPGAMVSVVCNGALNRSVKEFDLKEPGLILDKTKAIVIEEFEKSEDEVKDGMDIALIRLNKKTLQLQYAGAHNPLWIMRKGAEELEIIKADKHPIGKMDEDINFKTTTLQLEKGDTIYLFTDGYADQFGGSDIKPERKGGKKLKSSNLKKIIVQIQEKSMKEQQQYLEEAFEKWRGDLEQIDDVCIIGIRV